jgi:hypothetical protein
MSVWPAAAVRGDPTATTAQVAPGIDRLLMLWFAKFALT